MKIFGLINKNSGPGFHRIWMPLENMPEIDCYITNGVTEEDFEKRRPDWIYYNRLISDDVLLLQGRYHFRVAVDVDDWWHLDPHHVMFRWSRDNNGVAHAIKHLRIADLVTTTHERLAEKVYEFNKNVVILPNAIPDHQFFPTVRTEAVAGVRRVFWQGSVTHEADVNLLRKTVKQLSPERFRMVMAGYTEQVEWERMADCFTNYKKMPGVVLPGLPPHEYYSYYKYADVCVVPLLSTKFNAMKSNLKILEAAHMGLPVIASDVHPYKGMEGVMYARSGGDWKRLLEDWEQQNEQARVLKKYCDKHFNFDAINKLRKEALER